MTNTRLAVIVHVIWITLMLVMLIAITPMILIFLNLMLWVAYLVLAILAVVGHSRTTHPETPAILA